MKILSIIIVILLIAGFAADARDFYVGIPYRVGRGDVILSLIEIVKLFDEHAAKMGGAGFLYGIKSKLIGLFDDSHRDLLGKYILRTPEYIMHAIETDGDDPGLTKRFVKFCEAMPTTYDTRKSCREKMLRCFKILFPGKSDKFYKNHLNKIKNATQIHWIAGNPN